MLKILQRIMYNRISNYLNENEILNHKQFGFPVGHSTEHAILELIDQISNAFDNNSFVLGAFIDLSKSLDTVDHNILLEKLCTGIKEIILSGSIVFSVIGNVYIISKWRQKRKNSLTIKCGVPQRSILGRLLFIVYVNDLYRSSNILKPIIFADDTNLFYSGKH